MRYGVNLVYKDEKSLCVMIEKDQIKRFFEDLSNGQVYHQPDNDTGFWTDLNTIRYITIAEKEEASIEVVKQPKEEIGDDV